MRRTYLEARDLLEATGDESAAWAIAQQDEGLLPEVTKDDWLQFARANIDRNRTELQLRIASPMRSKARATHDVDGLGLFDHARQPSLF